MKIDEHETPSPEQSRDRHACHPSIISYPNPSRYSL